MKKFVLFFSLMLVTGLLAVNQADAQALVIKGEVSYLSDGQGGPIFESTETIRVVTPSGNYYIRDIFYLPPEWWDWIKGVFKMEVTGNYLIDGVPVQVKNLKAHFYPSGKIVISYHVNGSGNVTPGNDK